MYYKFKFTVIGSVLLAKQTWVQHSTSDNSGRYIKTINKKPTRRTN